MPHNRINVHIFSLLKNREEHVTLKVTGDFVKPFLNRKIVAPTILAGFSLFEQYEP